MYIFEHKVECFVRWFFTLLLVAAVNVEPQQDLLVVRLPLAINFRIYFCTPIRDAEKYDVRLATS